MAGAAGATDGGRAQGPRPAPPTARRPRRARWIRWLAALAVLGAVASAVAASLADSPRQVVVRLPAAVPTAAESPLGSASSGETRPAGDPAHPALDGPVLGALKTVWVETRGQPTRGVFGDLFAATTGIRWRDDPGGNPRAWQVELLTGTQPVPVKRARELAGRLHPTDATPVGIYASPLGETVEVFHSQTLAEAFGVDGEAARAVFGTDPPGTFIQIAERRGPTTTRVLLALGGHP